MRIICQNIGPSILRFLVILPYPFIHSIPAKQEKAFEMLFFNL